MNQTIDACEAVEKLAPELYAREYQARSDYQEDVCVGDFLNKFWHYPEGAARDIVKFRTHLGEDIKYLSEVARALMNTAIACAEVICLSDEALRWELPDFQAHCGYGGYSVHNLLSGDPAIQNGWMLTASTKVSKNFAMPMKRKMHIHKNTSIS